MSLTLSAIDRLLTDISGGLYSGSSRDPNLTNFVWQAAAAGKPVIGVSINYRLNAFGFLWGSHELKANGSANNGLRDQRLALRWIQENIASFGGDHRKVTLFGQSAGGLSIGKQLIAYGGRDDGLFRAAILQSGSMVEKWPYNVQDPTAYTEDLYHNLTVSTRCAGQPSELECLRSLPIEQLSAALNITDTPVFSGTGLGPWLTQVDGDFLIDRPTESVRSGRFLPVPIMYTTTSDEATVFMYGGKIDSDADFKAFVAAGGPDQSTVSTVEMLYPNVNAIGLPAEYSPTPEDDENDGAQWKRAVAFHTDVVENTSRRLVLDAWAKSGLLAYSGRFNIHLDGSSPRLGSHHAVELPYLFGSVAGEQADSQYVAMSELISRMWASFVVDLDPNNHGGESKKRFQQNNYSADQNLVAGAAVWPNWNVSIVDGVGSNIVFNTDDNGVSGTFVERDDFRLAQTMFLGTVLPTQMYY